MSYEDNLRRAIINTGRVFTEMAAEVTRKQNEEDRKWIDTIWQQAMAASIADGEQFTRYHFAALIAENEREACAQLCDRLANRMISAEECADAIRARGETMSNEEAEQFMEWVKARVPEPKREWVGLTEEEILTIDCKYKLSEYPAEFAAREAGRILKEKNT